MLEWLGDVGGLFDGLKLFTDPFIGFFATFGLKSTILSIAFKNIG